MDYIIYTTEGYTQNKEGKDTENCQILDFKYNSINSKEECLKEFLNENKEFNKEDIKIVSIVRDDIKELVQKLIIYSTAENLSRNKDLCNDIRLLKEYFNL